MIIHLPRGSKYVQALTKDIIVNETRVNTKHGHDSDQISAAKKVLPNLIVNLSSFKHFLLDTHVQAEAQHDRAVTGVAEHDREQKRECNYGVDRGIGLAVPGDSIGVNQGLKGSGVLVSPAIKKLNDM